MNYNKYHFLEQYDRSLSVSMPRIHIDVFDQQLSAFEISICLNVFFQQLLALNPTVSVKLWKCQCKWENIRAETLAQGVFLCYNRVLQANLNY